MQDKLSALIPASRPEAAWVVNEYRHFPNLWRQLGNSEKRMILDTIFAGLYFDRDRRLVRAVAYEPFKELLGLPENGMIVES